MIRPIPDDHGVGFFDFQRHPEYADTYREEKVDTGKVVLWNYYVTPENQAWPLQAATKDEKFVIDGFSPNLNKALHVGHLRQLALAKSIERIILNRPLGQMAETVAILGASLGTYSWAEAALEEWFDFLDYHPKKYYDVLMPRDYVEYRKEETFPGDKTSTIGLWDGPKGPVIVVRSDGRPTYSFYDLAFAKLVSPTHYITGVEQQEHFANLGLDKKHLPMGLVLGADGKKMKSRSGDSPTAQEILEQIIERLDETPQPRMLAWNVLAWNFLHVSRTKNVNYHPDEWTKSEAPGMYITYTHARISSALDKNPFPGVKRLYYKTDLTQADADLIGYANYRQHYLQRAIDTMDPAPIAKFAHDLARKLGVAYHAEKIKDGRPGFQYAVDQANEVLRQCMRDLGMFDLVSV